MINVQGLGSSASAGQQGLNRASLQPFPYGWKRLARIKGMQQHTERRSVRSSQLSMATVAFLENTPPASGPLQRKRCSKAPDSFKRQALVQETLLESKPSQIDVEGEPPVLSFRLASSSASCTQSAYCVLRTSEPRSVLPRPTSLSCCSWRLNLSTSLVQLCQYYAWSWHALYPLCIERGKRKQVASCQ